MTLIATGIDHLNLEVRNLAETVKFYSDLFGFEVRKEQPEQNSKIIGNDKIKLCLYEVAGFEKYQPVGFHHLGINVENFDEVIAKCEEMNIEILYGHAVEWEKSSSVYIVDPNGYEIELTKVFGGGI